MQFHAVSLMKLKVKKRKKRRWKAYRNGLATSLIHTLGAGVDFGTAGLPSVPYTELGFSFSCVSIFIPCFMVLSVDWHFCIEYFGGFFVGKCNQ